jgi:hypothetical protein
MMGMGCPSCGLAECGCETNGIRQGGGFLSDLGLPVATDAGGTGGRRRRAPAGANDGRRKRAEVVKKVMREKGLSMIDASKYVKAHNLY